MKKQLLSIIPLLLFEVMIQLGFFWLAPDKTCKWVVYAFLTALSLSHLMITYGLWSKYGIRRAAATIVAGSAVQVLIILGSVFLLSQDASIRSSVFLMLMLCLLYVILVSILWINIEGFSDNTENGPSGVAAEVERDLPLRNYNQSCDSRGMGYSMDQSPSINNHDRQENDVQSQRAPLARKQTPPPLPARN